MNEFTTALTSAVGTTTDMIQALGGKGVTITLAVLAVAVVSFLIRIGLSKGLRPIQGPA